MKLINFEYFLRDEKVFRVNAKFENSSLNVVMSEPSNNVTRNNLIRVLGGKKIRKDKLRGAIEIDGKFVERSNLNYYSTYIYRDSIFDESMTIRETIGMPLQLKQPQETLINNHKVKELIEFFNFHGMENKIIKKANLTRYQLKVLMIAQQLSMDPQIVCLEDPFYDMDAADTDKLISLLHIISNEGKTIIISTRQLSTESMAYVDDLLLLKNGFDIYNGSADKCIKYFHDLGIDIPNLSKIKYIWLDNSRSSLIDRWQINGVLSSRGSQTQSTTIQAINDAPNSLLAKHPSLLSQFTFTFIRRVRECVRIPEPIFRKFAENIIIAAYVGQVYVNQSQYSFEDQVVNRSGALYFFCVYMFLNGVYVAVETEVMQVFWREYGNGKMTSPPARLLARFFVELVILFFASYIFVLIPYYMIEYNPAFSSYLFISLFALMTALNGYIIGVLLNAIFDRAVWVMTATSYVVYPLILISGRFSINLAGWIAWQRYLSPIYYSYRAMIAIELDRDLPNCNPEVETNCNGLQQFVLISRENGLSTGMYLVISIAIFFGIWLASLFILWWRGRFLFFKL